MKQIRLTQSLRRPTPAMTLSAVLTGLLTWQFVASPDTPSSGTAPAETARVLRVIDGDTLVLTDQRRIRLLGVDAPELGRDGRPAQKGAEAARDWLRDQLRDQSVLLQFGPERLDHYGRTLAWISTTDGKQINRQLLAEGHARLLTRFGLPIERSEALHQAAARARVRRVGIWK